MGMLRCPTCLTLLDGGEARCPACRSRLRKRSQPIVLGESARIATNPQLNLDRELRDAAEATDAEARRRRRVAEATHRSVADTRPLTPRATPAPELVAELVWNPEPNEPQPSRFWSFASEPDAEVAPAPQPTLDTNIDLVDYTGDGTQEAYQPTPARAQRFIDLTAEPEQVLQSVPEHLADAPDDIHEMFEALHRKARADDEGAPAIADDNAPPVPSTRALRLTATRANRFRRSSHNARGDRSGSNDS